MATPSPDDYTGELETKNRKRLALFNTFQDSPPEIKIDPWYVLFASYHISYPLVFPEAPKTPRRISLEVWKVPNVAGSE
jgi:hypothetical protein